jgi:hypothetical protein
VLEHGNSDAVLVVGGSGHEEAMEELVDDPLHGGADPQVVSLGEAEPAASSHCFFTNIGVFIIEEIQDRILNEVDGTHSERLEIEHLECSQRQRHHLGALSDALVVGLLRFVVLLCDAALFDKVVEELLVVLVQDLLIELLQLPLRSIS